MSEQPVQPETPRFFKTSQTLLSSIALKFRAVKPGSSHLNGKIDRSQKTDKEEYYLTMDLRDETLEDQLAEWQHHYN